MKRVITLFALAALAACNGNTIVPVVADSTDTPVVVPSAADTVKVDTTTTTPTVCYEYTIVNNSGATRNAIWVDCCSGNPTSQYLEDGATLDVCSQAPPRGTKLEVMGGAMQCQNTCETGTTAPSNPTVRETVK